MKTKKGFTLVELLAVIVILAILVLLAVPSVLKMMDNAKENAFKIEAENIINGAKLKFANDMLNDSLPQKLELIYVAQAYNEDLNGRFLKSDFELNPDFMNQIEEVKVVPILGMSGAYIAGYCYNIADLHDYLDINIDPTTEIGSILIDQDHNSYYIWYTNNKYSITASTIVTGGSLTVDETTVSYAEGVAAYWSNCTVGDSAT